MVIQQLHHIQSSTIAEQWGKKQSSTIAELPKFNAKLSFISDPINNKDNNLKVMFFPKPVKVTQLSTEFQKKKKKKSTNLVRLSKKNKKSHTTVATTKYKSTTNFYFK